MRSKVSIVLSRLPAIRYAFAIRRNISSLFCLSCSRSATVPSGFTMAPKASS